MSMTQGGQIPGQPGLNHRRLAGGGSRRGGRARDCSSGAQSSRGGHARGAGARPHPERHAAAAETDGARRKRARGGAGVRVFVAMGLQWPWQRVHGTYSNYARRRACWTRRPGCLVAGAASAAGAVELGVVATACEEENGEGGNGQQLTTVTTSGSARLGRS